MGRLGLEPRADRLKAECSTTELATHIVNCNVFYCNTATVISAKSDRQNSNHWTARGSEL
jgi:hypothetical protein